VSVIYKLVTEEISLQYTLMDSMFVTCRLINGKMQYNES